MKIVVLDGYTLNPGDNPWDGLDALGTVEVFDVTPREQLAERIGSADIIITNKVALGPQELDAAENLKMIAVTATGYNVVDTGAARERGIPVCNVPVYGTEAVAQHVFAMLLSFVHRSEQHHDAVQAGEWQKRGHFCFWLNPIWELSGKTMGIVGLGRIGRATAHLAHSFGMKVIAHSRTQRDGLDYPGFEWATMDQLFEKSDVISLHCPQTEDNLGFVNAELINKMQPHSILINTARGTLINEQELATALNKGKIAGALLDVVSAEPIADDNPLLNANNCMLTPHIAWTAIEARKRLMSTTCENIQAFLDGHPQNVVN